MTPGEVCQAFACSPLKWGGQGHGQTPALGWHIEAEVCLEGAQQQGRWKSLVGAAVPLLGRPKLREGEGFKPLSLPSTSTCQPRAGV